MLTFHISNIQGRTGGRLDHLIALARRLTRQRARQLTRAGRRARPTAAYIARLTGIAVAAYLIAEVIPGASGRPVLAPLTALLVLQASVYQTLRAGLKKVASVTAGVLIAVGVSAFVPFSWWLLGLVIAGALLLGHVMRLGDELLEVPISAMLIFSASTLKSAATGRVVDTLVGSAAGLAGGLIFARLRTQPAREAVADLAWRLGDFLAAMAEGLREDSGQESPDPSPSGQPGAEQASADQAAAEQAALDRALGSRWLDEARALRDEIGRVDDALRQAEDSARLNPRALRLPADELPAHEVALRVGLETLEHSALYLRGLARSILDSARVSSVASPVRDPETRTRLSDVLDQLGIAIRTYGRLMQTLPSGDPALERQLEEQLARTRHLQDRLAVLLEPHAGTHEGDETQWPLRGEILSHVDRLRTALRLDDLPTHQALAQRGPLRRDPARRSLIRRGASRPASADPARPHSTDPARPRDTDNARPHSTDPARPPGTDNARPPGTGHHQDKPRPSARPEAIRAAVSGRSAM